MEPSGEEPGELDPNRVLLFIYGLVRIFAGFASNMADLESRTGLKADVLGKLNDPNSLSGLLARMPNEQAGRFVKFITDVSPILTKAGDIMTVSSEEKTNFARSIEKVLEKHRSLIAEAEGGS